MVRLLGSGSLSKSSSLTITCCSLAYSYPRTVSPHSTSRSQTGHQRSCLSRLLHSRCRRWNEMSLLSVAVNSFTGMLTIPKLIRPFHIERGMTTPFPALLRISEEYFYHTGNARIYKRDRLFGWSKTNERAETATGDPGGGARSPPGASGAVLRSGGAQEQIGKTH